MGDQKKQKNVEVAGEVRHALEGMDAHEEGPAAGHTVSPQDIGGQPAEEEQFFLRDLPTILGPSNLDRAVFCRQMATMIEVGIPLLSALQMLSKRTQNTRFARAIGAVAPAFSVP